MKCGEILELSFKIMVLEKSFAGAFTQVTNRNRKLQHRSVDGKVSILIRGAIMIRQRSPSGRRSICWHSVAFARIEIYWRFENGEPESDRHSRTVYD